MDGRSKIRSRRPTTTRQDESNNVLKIYGDNQKKREDETSSLWNFQLPFCTITYSSSYSTHTSPLIPLLIIKRQYSEGCILCQQFAVTFLDVCLKCSSKTFSTITISNLLIRTWSSDHLPLFPSTHSVPQNSQRRRRTVLRCLRLPT